jgi:hypothetical protein
MGIHPYRLNARENAAVFMPPLLTYAVPSIWISGVDFTSIDGLESLTVQTILSEVGLARSRFPTMKHFASCLGLCLGNHVSGGKSKYLHLSSRQSSCLCLPPCCSGNRSIANYFGGVLSSNSSLLRNTQSHHRHGSHKIARIFYRLWTSGEPYREHGADYYKQRYPQRVLDNLKKKASSLGLTSLLRLQGSGFLEELLSFLTSTCQVLISLLVWLSVKNAVNPCRDSSVGRAED